jgi:hypothetical protein
MESRPLVPAGSGDRFSGYAVLGVRFAAGDILTLRRFPATSVGPGYTSVWHRSPEGRWTMFQDIDVDAGCGKYFSDAVDRIHETPIRIVWTGADRFAVIVSAAEPITWDVQLDATRASRALGRMAAVMPPSLLRLPLLARTLGSAAGGLLGAGALTLTGSTPNGFHFVAHPRALWLIAASRASIGVRPVGAVVPNTEDLRLGDFRIPRRGLFAVARATLIPGDGVAGFARG